MLTTGADHFVEQGYAIFRETVTGDELFEARAELDAMMRALGPDERPERMTEPHLVHDYWLGLCRHPRVLDAVEAVLGPDLLLLMSHLIVKPPTDGMAVHWHQDNTYWPTVHGADIATVWLALDDADLENGCMTVIPGSHRGRPELERMETHGRDLLHTTVEVAQDAVDRAVPIELRAGDVSVHDSFLVHASAPNVSTRRRAGYTMRYGAVATTKIDPGHWAKVYRVRGHGLPLAPGHVDLRT